MAISLLRKNRSDRRVICDVCGQAYHVKDIIKVSDKANRHYGLLVCKFDNDPTNEHDRPFSVTEDILVSPDMVRDRPAQVTATNLYDDRVPGKPRNGSAGQDTLQSYIMNRWDGPIDCGSSGIIGYIVQRASPQGGFFETLVANTGYSSGWYLDLTGSLTADSYEYRCAAINSYGTGSYSNSWYYPSLDETTELYQYLAMSQSDFVITTSDDIPIRAV